MGATSKEKETDIQNLTKDLTVLPFTAAIAVKSAQIYHRLRSTNKIIEFRDIFIAATCIVNKLPIVTTNNKHFRRIDELKIIS